MSGHPAASSEREEGSFVSGDVTSQLPGTARAGQSSWIDRAPWEPAETDGHLIKINHWWPISAQSGRRGHPSSAPGAADKWRGMNEFPREIKSEPIRVAAPVRETIFRWESGREPFET